MPHITSNTGCITTHNLTYKGHISGLSNRTHVPVGCLQSHRWIEHAHLYAVTLHADQKAGRQLGPRGASIEESWGGMCEPAFTQQMVRLNGAVDVCLVDPHGHSHQHVLRSLHYLAVDSQQVRPL